MKKMLAAFAACALACASMLAPLATSPRRSTFTARSPLTM
jgi:hypothetical protein